ncbi:YdcF family protein [Melghirimyces algeriensis]|uniref:Uncharacterized SAM-binding protein YcdF, DUF218 family n=1 Tax=Melghirimyces algeriensis TaxID=910412 RepID=A0A521AD65_9BACL|nr:YdcF family protein [Melghirimyces algeriensis]SMO32753.1 Uncharacterized SAM-binding protein YcdF, DUF218 family [Melghirimyces algeriensis]
MKRWIIATLLGLALIITGILGSLWFSVSQYDGTAPGSQSRDAALILGAAMWGDKPSWALEERLEVALDLYKQNQVDKLILSGGIGDDAISEAEGMKRYLTERGVDQDDLILEDQSTSTEENVRFSRSLMKKNHIQDIYVVTHDYHMHRALHYAQEMKINAHPAPAHSRVLFTPYWKARECLALIKEAII